MRRGDQNISSTLMLTLFDRVMSSIYDDKMQVKFLPSQGIVQEQINAYNTLAQSDYQEMAKAKLDYDWCWDSCKSPDGGMPEGCEDRSWRTGQGSGAGEGVLERLLLEGSC